MSENNLKLYNIIYLPELPSNDDDIDHESTKIAIPSEEKGKFKLYAWFDGRWVCTCIIESFINKSDFELKGLKDACNDLNNAANKLTKISANTESDELSSKLEKITAKILQAKYELADDVIKHFGENELPEGAMDFDELRGYIWAWIAIATKDKNISKQLIKAFTSIDYYFEWFIDRVNELESENETRQ